MKLLTSFFNEYLQNLFEPITDDEMQFGFSEGLRIRNLRLKCGGINDLLKDLDMAFKILSGRSGRMRMTYTALPGIITIQLKDVELQLKPEWGEIAARNLGKHLEDFSIEPEHPRIYQYREQLAHSRAYESATKRISNRSGQFLQPPPVIRRAKYTHPATPSASSTTHYTIPQSNQTRPMLAMPGYEQHNISFVPPISNRSNYNTSGYVTPAAPLSFHSSQLPAHGTDMGGGISPKMRSNISQHGGISARTPRQY